MPALFVTAIIFGTITLIAAAAWAVARPAARRAGNSGDAEDARIAFKVITGVLAGITATFVLLSTFATVSTQNVGIETSFGRPVGDLSNGFHLTPPWVNVTEMDNAVQTDIYEGGNCITVRIADQQTACAQVRIRWQMRQSAGDQLFRQYQTSDNVRTRLVSSELYTAMNDQFDGYNPIGSLTTTAKLGSALNPTVPQIAKHVTTQMQHEIGNQIHVFQVLVPIITFDNAVQRQLNAVLTQKAATDVALQAEQTATAQAQAARNLAKSTAFTPGVLEQNCLNIVGEAMKANYTLPQGWNCTGTSSVGVLTSGSGG